MHGQRNFWGAVSGASANTAAVSWRCAPSCSMRYWTHGQNCSAPTATVCDRIEYGVEKELYQSACYFVETFDYNCYPDLDETALTRQMSVAKVCEIMNWAVKDLGFIDGKGFCVPLNRKPHLVGECLHLNDEELAVIKEAAGDQVDRLGY